MMTARTRLAVLSPVLETRAIDVDAQLRAVRRPDEEIENFFLADGPCSIETEEDVAKALPGILETGARIASHGWHAIVINCMCDPGVRELRASLAIPVFGPAETSMHLLAAAGRRFSVLDVVSEGRELVEWQVEAFRVADHYVSHHAIDVPVLELYRSPERTVVALVEAAQAALREGADAVLLGCTGLAELAAALEARLPAGTAVVAEPFALTVGAARALIAPLSNTATG
jgi:allantoin racemase